MKEEKLWSAFKYFDTTNNGYITPQSVIEALTTSNIPVNYTGMNDAFQELKQSQKKKINFEEFKRIFNK